MWVVVWLAGDAAERGRLGTGFCVGIDLTNGDARRASVAKRVLRMGGVGGRSPPTKTPRQRSAQGALSTRETRRVTRVAINDSSARLCLAQQHCVIKAVYHVAKP